MKTKVYTWLFVSFLWVMSIQAQNFAGGNGTEANPYPISTPEQLNNLRNYLGGGANSLLHFKIVNDIDLRTYLETHNNSAGWEPIGYWGTGTENTRFKAKIHGGGHAIRGLWINRPTTDFVGLFGVLGSGCFIDSLILEVYPSKIQGNTNVGALAGIVMAAATIEDCSSNAYIEGNSKLGGLVGETRGIINRCFSSGYVRGNSSVGGLIGVSMVGTAIQISSSYSDAEVTAYGGQVGGFVGWNKGQISNCYSRGDVWGEGNGKGGFAGVNGSPGVITNSYSVGYVYSAVGYNTGGFVGNNSSVISNCYFDYDRAQVERGIGLGSGGVEGKYTYEMKQQETFVGWDFSSVWQGGNYYTYPRLIWDSDSPCFAGKGTQEDPYLLFNAWQLNCLHDYVGEAGRGKFFVLTSDIDLVYGSWNSEEGWEPIGSVNYPFEGYLFGQGFSIKNLRINRPEEDNVGLFGVIGYSKIADIVIDSVTIEGRSFVGCIAGVNNNGTIFQCKVQNATLKAYNVVGGIAGKNAGRIYSSSMDGSVVAFNVVGGIAGENEGPIHSSLMDGRVKGMDAVGGIAGTNYSEIDKSSNASEIEGNNNVGGLSGVNEASGTISRSFNMGNVGGWERLGGLCGLNYGRVTNSYSSGTIQGAKAVGGLFGGLYSGNVSYCYSSSDVIGTERKGGIIGELGFDSPSITSCYYDKELFGSEDLSADVGAKSTAEMHKKATFVGWDFTNIWQIDENSSYPYLRYLPEAPFYFAASSEFYTLADRVSQEKLFEENNREGADLLVYPNPTEGIVHFNFEEQGSKEVKVVDVRGKLVYTGMTTNTLDLSYLKKGLYLIQVNGQMLKLVKK